MAVWSFCPNQLKDKFKTITLKNKGWQLDLEIVHALWVNWIKDFAGAETKKEWALSHGIHDAIFHQVSYRSKTYSKFYMFENDYQFYHALLGNVNYEAISPANISQIEPNSYILVSQPNHEGKITDWFEPLKEHCRKNNCKIFLDCAFYGCTFDKMDTSDPVFDAVAFSLSKNFQMGGWRAGIVFADDLPKSLTTPINYKFGYTYFNIAAVEMSKIILIQFKPTYMTEVAKPIQLEYCAKNNLRPADIWMWAFKENGEKICITELIKADIQKALDLKYP